MTEMGRPTSRELHALLDPLTGEGTGVSLIDLDVAIEVAILKCPTDSDMPTLWILTFLSGWLWGRERLAPLPGPG